MRRRTTFALVVGGAAAAVASGTIARSRARGREPAIPKPVSGVFPNGMAYVRWGSGPKTLLLIPGGPGNAVPSGVFLSFVLRPGGIGRVRVSPASRQSAAPRPS